MKEDACMKFYNETKPLYLQADASGVGLVAAYHKPEVVQTIQEIKHQTTTY